MTFFNPVGAKRARSGLAKTSLINKLTNRIKDQAPVVELGQVDDQLDRLGVVIGRVDELAATDKVGFYVGTVLIQEVNLAAFTSDIDLTDFFDTDEVERIVVGNLAEINAYGSPLSTAGDTYLIGVIAGYDTETDLPIMLAYQYIEEPGQYQGMVRSMVSQNQPGWDFTTLVSPIPFIIP